MRTGTSSSSKTTLCGKPALFFQVTDSPALMVMEGGSNAWAQEQHQCRQRAQICTVYVSMQLHVINTDVQCAWGLGDWHGSVR